MPANDSTRTKASGRWRRRLGRVLTLLALGGAGWGAWLAAETATGQLEQRLARDSREALAEGGNDWAQVRADGTLVHLGGTAPDEVTRYRALVQAEGALRLGRIVDEMQIAAAEEIAPPAFQIQLLRNGPEVTVIGLVPAGLDRQSVIDGLEQAGAGQVSDLLETADYPIPEHWDQAFSFGLRAARLVPRAKITIEPGHVAIQATADSAEQRDTLQQALTRDAPQGIVLDLEISAPRPVIAPFTLRFVLDEDGARFDACTADTEPAREAILAAGARAGAEGQADCRLGLGAPSAEWGEAAALAIDALGSLGAGSVTVSDAEIALHAPASVEAAHFDEVSALLETALPQPFALTARRAEGDQPEGPAEFTAQVPRPGHVVLRGRIADERMRDTVESFARSRFGIVDSTLQLDPELPGGWTVRAIAALEAMAELERGTIRVGSELIRIEGVSGSQGASDTIAMRLADRLGAGAGYEMAIGYDRRLDPLLGLPSGAECIDQLNTIMRESVIGFEPNRSVIAGDAEPTLDLLAEAMTNCAEFRIEAGGHTDSQGSDSFNARLSQQRAEALLRAMTDHGIDTALMTAHGYGESQPIADNDTEAGREANRRIEFRLLSEEPVRAEPIATPATVTGVTGTAEGAGQPAPDPRITPVPSGAVRQGAQGAASHDLAHAAMVATILVTDLALSPEVTVETIDELEGVAATPAHAATAAVLAVLNQPGDAHRAATGAVLDLLDRAAAIPEDAPLRAATGAVLMILGRSDPAEAAATLGLRAIGGEVPVLTPGPDTPRPLPRP